MSTILVTPMAGRIADVYGARPTLLAITTIAILGGALGVVLAGPVAENISRTAMYAVPTAFVILGALAFAVSTPRDRISNISGRLDWPGAGGLALGLLTLTAWLASASSDGWGAPTSMLLVLAAAAVLSIWARYQSRTHEPMVDLTMMRHR